LIRDGQYTYNIEFQQGITNIKDIKNIYIKKADRILQIKDFADVSLVPEIPVGYNINNGVMGITLAIYKHPDARMDAVKEKVVGIVEDIENENPEVKFDIERDQTRLLTYSINNLKHSLYLGLIFAVVIMFLLMGSKKLPLLIVISIPVSLLISMFFLDLFSLSINIISLSGLILGVGMMIDNSIVVIDNIKQFHERNFSCSDACILGTNEVIRPLISSVLTTCSVFMPLIFLSGIAGALFFDQAVAVTITLLVSLLVSIILLPVLYKLIYKEGNEELKYKSYGNSIMVAYQKGLLLVLNNKVVSISLFFLSVPLAYILFTGLNKRLFPLLKETELIANIEWSDPVSVDENKRRIMDLMMSNHPIRSQYTASIGKTQYMFGESVNQLTTESSIYIFAESEDEIDAIKYRLKKKFNSLYSESIIQFFPVINIFNQVFKEEESPLVVRIRTDENDEEAIRAIQHIADSISGTFGFDDRKMISPEVITHSIVVNFEKLLLYDLDYHNLISKLKSLFSRNNIGSITINNDLVNINISSGDEGIISIYQTKTDRIIYSDGKGRYYPREINADFGNYYSIMKTFESIFGKLKSISFSWGGNILENVKLFNELMIVLIVSVLLLYLILAAQFESLIQPVIVLLEVVFDICGSLLFLYLFNSSLNIMSAIGIVVMSGIVINDSILKIDTINNLRRSGMSLYDSVKIGGERRFKPIIMTSITTILALLPMMVMSGMGVELQIPLALAIIGGLFVGTFVSLYFIPLTYIVIYEKIFGSK
jgi:multidrug efflux pump subunit AcrB